MGLLLCPKSTRREWEIDHTTMYNLGSKILPLFLDPLVLAALLLMCAFLVRKRWSRISGSIYISAMLLLVFLGCPAVSGWLTRSLEGQYPDYGAATSVSAQAIVVLGGAINLPRQNHARMVRCLGVSASWLDIDRSLL